MQSPVKLEHKHLACKCSVFQENDFLLLWLFCSGNWTNSFTSSTAFIIECALPRHQNDLNVAVEAFLFILPQPNFRQGFSSYTVGGGWNPSLVQLSVLCNTRQIILPSHFTGIRHPSVNPAGRFHTPLAPLHLCLLTSWLHKYSQWHSGLHPIPHPLRHLRQVHAQLMRECKKRKINS